MSTPDPNRPHRGGRLRWFPCWAAGLAVVLPAVVPLGAARAQLLPHLGTAVELGNLRQAFEQAYGPVTAPISPQAWSVTPAIDAEVIATDNAQGLGTVAGAGGFVARRGSELMTVITPSIAIAGQSRRLTGVFNYAPSFRSFARDSRQNSVGHNLNANATLTIFEDLFFLNASAFAAESSRLGGLGGGVGNNVARRDRVQTTSVSLSPQLRHAFSDWGVGSASYTISQITQSGIGLRTNTPFAPAVRSTNTITNTANVSFTSGEAFGRINFTLAANRTYYKGQGALRNSERGTETLDLGYAATRTLTLLGLVGHQSISYGGQRPIRINEMIWNLGFRWNPDPDTTMTLRYGRRDGGDNFTFEGNTAPTARTRVSASYSEAMASLADELQLSLTRGTTSGNGLVIDPITGMPVLVTNNFAGTQGGVSRVRRASLSAVLLQDADTYTLTVNRDDRLTLSADAPGGAPSVTWLTATLSWQRELQPGLRGNAQVTYGDRSGRGFGSQEMITFSTGLSWALSETLSTRATYTYTQATSNRAGLSYTANLLAVGVRKSF